MPDDGRTGRRLHASLAGNNSVSAISTQNGSTMRATLRMA